MKNLNRNLYLIIVGIAEILFFTYAMVLYRRGIIDTFHFQMGCIFAGGVGVLAVILAFSKHSWFGKNNDGDFNPALIEVPHTLEGIVFEVLTGLIIVVAWILAIATDRFWIIEGFFSFLSPIFMFVLSIMAITFSWIVYLPRFKFRSEVRKHNVKQIALEIRLCRVLAVELALCVLMSALPLELFSISFNIFMLTGFLATVAIFGYLVYQARNNSAGIKQSDVHNEATDSFDIDEVKMPRTALGTLTEILIGTLVVLAWVVSVINGRFTDKYGSFNVGTLFILLPITIAIIKFIWNTYRPGKMRDMGQLTNLKQAKLAVWLYRTYAIIVAIFLLLYSFPNITESIDPLWVLIGFFATSSIVYLIFRTLIRRTRD